MDKSSSAQLWLFGIIGVATIATMLYLNQLNSKVANPKFQDSTMAAYLTRKDSREAREWLKSGNESTRKIIDSTGKGLTYSQWGPLVEQLYSYGAKKIFFAGVMKDGASEVTHGMFLELPDDPTQRKQIFSSSPLTWPVRSAPPQDGGQKYVLVWFD